MAIEYGLLGRTLAHSYSPAIHEKLAGYRYELIEKEPDEVRDFLAARQFRGLNVTIPYKKDAFAACDAHSETAKLTGAVNTILNDDGRLIGHNTDFDGFLSMLTRKTIDLRGKKAAVLGSGGSGRMAEAALRHLGARPLLISRAGPVTYEALRERHADRELLINATPVGMFPANGESPTALHGFDRLTAVYDLIYNPFRTALLLDAEERGLYTQNGLWMLIAQARRAAELFTGASIDEAIVGAIYRDLRSGMENVVLIGMPGCGKSSVGRALAARMGRAFVDIDEEIARREGRSIPEIFAAHGEAGFRDRESALIAETAKKSGQVIATGGGAVLRPENVRMLRQNGELLFIDRPIDQLAMDERPLSKSAEALHRMADARLPLYRRCAARTIANTDDIESAARAAEEGFYEATRH